VRFKYETIKKKVFFMPAERKNKRLPGDANFVLESLPDKPL
jgi:hypothetical protein